MGARSLAIRGLAVLIAAALFLSTGEAALRLLYRDAGRRTLGGPGGRSFEHLTIGREQLRGRRDTGPHRDGVPRLMVIGDSITYGQGVRDWHDTWPEVLVSTLEAEGKPHELAVFAEPGRDIPKHLEELERWGPVVKPDVLIYQWYVNDIEVVSHRPDRTQRWQRWPGHDWLRRTSYLYYFLDYRASELAPPPDRTYVEYIVQDFRPGTAEWSEFERHFHAFAVRAAALALRRILMLYPQVPYRDRYPLQPLHEAMTTLAGAHTLSIPPVVWLRSGGALDADPAAPWKLALRIPAANAGQVADTQDYVLAPGRTDAEVVLRAADLAEATASVGSLQVLDAATGAIVATHDLTATGGVRGYQTVTVPLTSEGPDVRRVRFRVTSSGRTAWSLGGIGLAVDYGFDVLDLAEPLNRFNTHASLFDAHPNEAAHRVMAEQVRRVLLRIAE
jgi:hypothetical protein